MICNALFLKGRTILFSIVALLVMASASWSATYYVDKSNSKASDSNPGTESAPFKTIQKGVNVAVAGDTVFVKGGTYNEKITGVNSGKAGSPITFKNYGSDVVTIDGTGISADCTVKFSNKNYIIWDGLNVTNGVSRGAWFEGDHNIIQNSKIYNNGTKGSTGNTGLEVINSDSPIVRNNIVYNNGWNGISIAQCNNATVENNVSYNNTAHMGIQLFQSYSQTGKMWDNNNVRYNTIYNNENGIFSIQQEYNEISNNLIFNNSGLGIVFVATDNGISTYEGHTKVFNNTISGNGRDGIRNNSATYLIIKNNILANNTEAGIYDAKNSSTHQIDYDLYYNNGHVFIGGGSYSTVSSLSTSKGYEKHGISGNPLFNNVSQMDYSLKSGSPAIDAGTDVSSQSLTPITDILGTPRPQNGYFDIGAYEFGGGAVTINPPSNLRVQNSQ